MPETERVSLRDALEKAQSRREHYQARYAEQYDRAVKAERALERVRALCDQADDYATEPHATLDPDVIRAALDGDA